MNKQKMYAIYDMKYKEQCLGIFETLQEIVNYLGISNKNVLSSAIAKENKLHSRYIVKIIQ